MPPIVIHRVRSAPAVDDWHQYREIADRDDVWTKCGSGSTRATPRERICIHDQRRSVDQEIAKVTASMADIVLQ